MTTGFTVPLHSQYCINLQTKKKWASKNFLHMHDDISYRTTGKLSCNYPRSELSKEWIIQASLPVSDEVQVPNLCEAEDSFCPEVQKSAAEVIPVLEV